MTADEAREELVRSWMEMAREAIASAESERRAGRGRFVVNRCYYACFYAASAALLREGRSFARHAALRQSLHKDLVHTGRLDARYGQTFDELFGARHDADYAPLTQVSDDAVARAVQDAREFVAAIERLIVR